jgi:hypothetical protein
VRAGSQPVRVGTAARRSLSLPRVLGEIHWEGDAFRSRTPVNGIGPRRLRRRVQNPKLTI